MGNAIDKTSLRDKELLKIAANGGTGTDMEEATGMPAAEAVLRVKEIIGVHRSAFDSYERRELAMLSLLRLKAQMEKAGIDDQDPKAVEAYAKLNTHIDKMSLNNEKISDEDLNRVTEAQARKLLQLIETAYGYARTELKNEYGDFIDMTVIDTAFQEGLRRASQDVVVL